MFRRIVLLSGSATFAQFLMVAVGPILSRIYLPADFAMFAFFQSLMSVVSLILTLQFEQAITLPESKQVADSVRRLALRTALALTLLMTGACLWLHSSGRLQGLWLTPVLFCLLPCCSMIEAWARTYRIEAVREAAFRRMSLSRILLSVGTVIGQLGCFLAGFKSLGLILGDGIGRLTSVGPFLLGRRVTAPEAPSLLPMVVLESPTSQAATIPSSLAGVAYEFRKFALFLTPAAVLALLVNVSPALLLPGLFGDEFAGQFALANRTILLPFLVISQAVTHVYVAEASRMIRSQDGQLSGLLRGTAWQLVRVGGCLALPAMLAGPWLFPLVFGAQWTASGELVPWLALSGFAQFVGGPLNQVLILTREEGRKFAMNLLGLVSIGAVLWAAARFGLTGYQATACYSATVLIVQSLYVVQSFIASQRQVVRWERDRRVSPIPVTPFAA